MPGDDIYLSVILMAYNEAANVEPVAREIAGALAALGRRCELLVVDDGSTDGTGALADRLAGELPGARVIHHRPNRGLGGVYRTGFAEARGTLLTFFPADGQFPATIIPLFVAAMEGVDMVLGYLPERRGALPARALSQIEKMIYRLLFGPMPKFQGVLMFRRALLDDLELKSTGRGWAVLMELIIRAARGGYRLVSVPTTMRPRLSGVSKVNNLRTIWANLRQVVGLQRYL